MITAIRTKLLTGSITNVIPKGQNILNPEKPYVVIWIDVPIEKPGSNLEGINEYVINCHYPKGYINQLDDYINNEVVTLLDNQLLTTRDGRKVRLHRTMRIGSLVENNDDNTISRERRFITAAFY